jgi:hypothetical protein
VVEKTGQIIKGCVGGWREGSIYKGILFDLSSGGFFGFEGEFFISIK